MHELVTWLHSATNEKTKCFILLLTDHIHTEADEGLPVGNNLFWKVTSQKRLSFRIIWVGKWKRHTYRIPASSRVLFCADRDLWPSCRGRGKNSLIEDHYKFWHTCFTCSHQGAPHAQLCRQAVRQRGGGLIDRAALGEAPATHTHRWQQTVACYSSARLCWLHKLQHGGDKHSSHWITTAKSKPWRLWRLYSSRGWNRRPVHVFIFSLLVKLLLTWLQIELICPSQYVK